MLGTPTSTFTSLARGGSKVITWKVYVRKVTVLNTALTGTWTEVTSRIDIDSFQGFEKRIEFDMGQFTSNPLELRGMGISWWKSNVFNASASEYIELKLTFQLIGASDVFTVYSGFVDKARVRYDELSDSIDFSATTVDEIGQRLAGEYLSTQFLHTNVDGSGATGIALQGIPGVFVTDANYNSRPLKTGLHTIIYTVTGGTKYISLDSGNNVTISASGYFSIGDIDNTLSDTQQLRCYVANTAHLPSSGTYTDNVIVTVQGTTLPNQWNRNITAQSMLSSIYSRLGISSITYDAMSMVTWDGGFRIYYHDTPPNNVAISTGASIRALSNDGTDVFVGVSNGSVANVYRKNVTTGQYTLLASIATGRHINKLLYNARNNHLFIILTDSSFPNAAMILYRYDITGSTLSGSVTLEGTQTNTAYTSVDLLDYNYTGSSWKYGIVYADTVAGVQDIRFCDGSALTVSNVGVSNASINTRYLFASGAYVWYKRTNGGNDDFYQISVNGSGAFVNDGLVLSGVPQYSVAIYYDAGTRIYFAHPSGGCYSHTTASATTTNHSAHTPVGAMAMKSGNIYYASKTLGTERIMRVTGTSAAVEMAKGNCLPTQSAFTYAQILWGVTSSGNSLYSATSTVPFIIPLADFSGMSIKDALNKVLMAFNLVQIISASKAAFVYRRGNEAGVPQSSGNILSIRISDASSIQESQYQYSAVDIVTVTGQTKTTKYSAAGFDAAVLSDKAEFSVNNDFISDQLIKDMAYYFYQFFDTAKTMVSVKMGAVPLFHYEVFDAVNVTFASPLKLTRSIVGTNTPIYAIQYGSDGTMNVEFLT